MLELVIGLLILTTAIWGIYLFVRWISLSFMTIDTDPIPMDNNWRCPQCNSWWYYIGEEIHFAGCIAALARKHEAKTRSE